ARPAERRQRIGGTGHGRERIGRSRGACECGQLAGGLGHAAGGVGDLLSLPAQLTQLLQMLPKLLEALQGLQNLTNLPAQLAQQAQGGGKPASSG
ncbi:hypothetical protein ACWD00_33905, partial [Streptomyces viridiviolaceus]